MPEIECFSRIHFTPFRAPGDKLFRFLVSSLACSDDFLILQRTNKHPRDLDEHKSLLTKRFFNDISKTKCILIEYPFYKRVLLIIIVGVPSRSMRGY